MQFGFQFYRLRVRVRVRVRFSVRVRVRVSVRVSVRVRVRARVRVRVSFTSLHCCIGLGSEELCRYVLPACQVGIGVGSGLEDVRIKVRER